uniref:Contactin 1b n=1 Tax=Esox lucius TaxID=8010 RepID=A0AAY5K0V1_ESOLU
SKKHSMNPMVLKKSWFWVFLFILSRFWEYDATGYGPVFEEEPLDIVYTKESPDKRISMNCRARGNPAPTYRWRRDNWEIKLLELPTDHYSLVGGNLIINNPDEKKHAGTYVCVAKNIYGTVISKEAKVKFGFLEEFPDEERDPVTVKQGQGAVLICDPPKHEVTFQWIFNEFPRFLHPDKRRFVSQSTGNLYISKVEESDAGNYSCYVFNPQIGKGVYSKFISLIPIEELPERKYKSDLVVKFPDTTAMLNYNVTLECFALGNPAPHIVWRKIGATDLPASAEVSMGGALLHLYNVQYEDASGYECEAINQKWQDWHQAWLYVEAAPEWAVTINNTQKDVGSEHTMSCVANGKPTPYIRWLKDGFSYGKGELKFSSLTFDDSGMYQCIAENYWGIIYASAELRVIACAPTFEFNPVKKYLLGANNGRVVIECKPRAAPRPKFTWTKGKEVLFNNSRISIMFDGSLEILNATRNDEGLYTCFAENDKGKANSSGILTITEATQITVAPEDTVAMVGDEVRLQCQASYDPSLDVTFIWSLDFRVIDLYLEWKHYQRVMVSASGGGNSGELKIMNVQIAHEGRYTCTAQTVVDNVTASADLKVKGRPGPPGGVRVEEIRDTSVKLVWNRGADHGNPVLGYTIQTRDFYALTKDDWRVASTSPTALNGMAVMADVVDLYPWMQYEFRVYATNEFGDGEASVPSIKIKTWDAVPVVAPTNVGGYGGKDGELVVTWTPVKPQFFYGKKFGYVVAFKPHDGSDWWYETISDPETRRYVHRDSSFGVTSDDFQVREFQVKVKTFNIKGDGPYSLTTTVYYPRDVPSESPTDVYARPVSSHEALVWWLPLLSRLSDQVKYWRKYDDTEPGANRIFVPATANQTRLENMRPDSHYLIEVRAYNGAGVGPPSEHCEMFTKRALFPIILQGMDEDLRKTGYITGPIYMTGWHFMDFPMPQVGDYELEVRGRYEGGDGPIRKIRLQGKASFLRPTLNLAAVLLLALCIMGLET